MFLSGELNAIELDLKTEDQKIIEGQTVDLRTAQVQPTGVTLLREVRVGEDSCPSAACQIGPNTYVGFANGVIKKIQLSNGSIGNFTALKAPITGMSACKDKIYCLQSQTGYVTVLNLSGGVSGLFLINKTGAGNDMVIVGNKLVVSNKAAQVLQVYSIAGNFLRQIKCLQWTRKVVITLVACGEDSVILCDTASQRVMRVNVNTGYVLWNTTKIVAPLSVTLCGGKVIVMTSGPKPEARFLDPNRGSSVYSKCHMVY